jgi:predicted NBD/HSP70 family sugar kinase
VTDLRDKAPIRAADIKERNERLVLGMVFRAGQASQSEVAMVSGLKAPTVFRIFGELERSGLIAPVSTPPMPAADRKGRRPTWYSTVPGAYRVVGLDFRAGGASVVIEDFSAKVLYSEERPIRDGAGADEAYDVVAGLASDALEHVDGGPLPGIGVGAPGVVDLAGGSVLDYQRIGGLSGFPFADRLLERFGATVRMGNNATIATMAAYRYGVACGQDGGTDPPSHGNGSLGTFSLLVRTGVGGAFIRDGIPYENAGRTAIGIGHMTMDIEGPSCPCGGRGCLEAYLAEDSLIAAVRKARPCADLAELDRLIASEDPSTLGAIAEPLLFASTALLNIRHLLDPDGFIIISRSSALSTCIAAEADRHLANHPRTDGSAPRIRGYRWDPVLAGMAACDMIFDAFFA